MTEYDAIERISEISMRPSYGDHMTYRLAIKALKKQIPQKPIIADDEIDEFGNIISCIWECPECREEVDCDDYYCRNCGQKLDWRDE